MRADAIPASGGAPEISVVIPTKGRNTRLAFALDALAAQTLAPERFEVIVVRSAGAEGAPIPLPPGLPARVISDPGLDAVSKKRNAGWRSARAPLVAFTDDDCRPSPDWLEKALEAASDPALVVQGRTIPDPDERHLLHGLARSQEIIGPSSWHQTCNIVYPRAMLERLDGFDEAFFWGSEDTDLGLRAIAAGARMAYADDCLVLHAVNARTARQALRDAKGRNTIPRLVQRHPEQREALYGRIFWTRAHAFLLLGFLATLISRRRRAALVGWAPYVWESLSAESLRGPRRALRSLLSVPPRAAVDAVEVAVTVRAAIANRTPVI